VEQKQLFADIEYQQIINIKRVEELEFRMKKLEDRLSKPPMECWKVPPSSPPSSTIKHTMKPISKEEEVDYNMSLLFGEKEELCSL